MKKIFLALCCIMLTLETYSQTEVEIVSKRVLKIINAFQYIGYDTLSDASFINEYWHSDSLGSGMPMRLPDDIQDVDDEPGVYIINDLSDIHVADISKRVSQYIAQGRISFYLVKVEYTVLAERKFGNNVDKFFHFYDFPQVKFRYIAILLDEKDNKWKYYDSNPNTMYFYTKDFFCKYYKLIESQYNVLNIEKTLEILQK